MKVEIWSDIMCPFCYIGKRQFEKALQTFRHRDEVEIIWRSFQLDPNMQYESGKTIHQVLAGKKGLSIEQAKQLGKQVSNAAREVGLEYDFDKTIPANTFHAHRLSHLAAKYNLQDKMEERLFHAYFSEGKNIGDLRVLLQLGVEVGVPEKEIFDALETNAFSDEVYQDSEQAREFGIRGVPFFVINEKYAVSGAQSADLFKEALQTAWNETQNKVLTPDIEKTESNTCSVNDSC